MITRIMKLHKHDNVLIGRDLSNIFKNGFVYEIKEFGGECVITCLGPSALPENGPMTPNQNSTIGAIMMTGTYLMTQNEHAKIYHEDKKYDEELPYLVKPQTIINKVYNPFYGDERICECGHTYYRHFDSYADMENCGCKYCRCDEFKEQK